MGDGRWNIGIRPWASQHNRSTHYQRYCRLSPIAYRLSPIAYRLSTEKGGQLLQPEIIVLGVAVVAEAAVLGGVLTGLVRLRARLGSLALASGRPDPSQHTLDNPVTVSGHVAGNDGSTALVNDGAAALVNDGSTALVNDGAAVLMMARLDAFVEETGLLGEALVSKLEERLARYETALAGATDGAALSPRGASMTRLLAPTEDAPDGSVSAEDDPGGMAEDAAVEDSAFTGSWDVFDIQTAREKGMDPLGVALQRSLSTRGA